MNRMKTVLPPRSEAGLAFAEGDQAGKPMHRELPSPTAGFGVSCHSDTHNIVGLNPSSDGTIPSHRRLALV